MNLTTETTSAFLRLLEIEQLRAFICLELRQMEEEGFGCAGFQERLDKCG